MRDVTKDYQYVQDRTEKFVDLNGLAKAMRLLYGPNFVGGFDPKCCNIRTGEVMRGTVHHCTHGEPHDITKTCYTKGHQAYCHEFMIVEGWIVRCGMRYKVLSGGCGTHKATLIPNSINLKIKNLISGKRDFIPWSELDDMGELADQATDRVSAKDKDKKAIFAAHKQAEEEADASNEPLPADHAVYNQHLAFREAHIQRKRTEAEVRKKLAAERKPGYTEQKTGPGRLKQKVNEDTSQVPGIQVELERRRLNGGKSSKKSSGKHNLSKFAIKRRSRMPAEPTIPE